MVMMARVLALLWLAPWAQVGAKAVPVPTTAPADLAAGPSWLVMLGLAAALGLSCLMFAVLVQRWTTQRRRVDLSDWARAHGWTLYLADDVGHRAPPPPPPPLDAQGLSPRVALSDGKCWLIESEPAPPLPPTSAIDAPRVAAAAERALHVLVRPVETQWPPTGLRPSTAVVSVVDRFSLSSFVTMTETERFTLYGSDTHAAAALTDSSARALLPPDVGLLLHGNALVLDFSSRPFDTIEFGRMLALAEQVVAHLPVSSARGR